MGLIILLAFIAIPAIEIGLFIEIGGEIGAWQTVGLIFLTAIIGAALFRYQGFGVLRRVQSSMAQNTLPVEEAFNGVGLLLAGALLMLPGFATDIIGFLLFIPPLRVLLLALLVKSLLSRGNVHFSAAGSGFQRRGTYGDDGVIDGDYDDVTPDDASETPDDQHRLPPKS